MFSAVAMRASRYSGGACVPASMFAIEPRDSPAWRPRNAWVTPARLRASRMSPATALLNSCSSTSPPRNASLADNLVPFPQHYQAPVRAGNTSGHLLTSAQHPATRGAAGQHRLGTQPERCGAPRTLTDRITPATSSIQVKLQHRKPHPQEGWAAALSWSLANLVPQRASKDGKQRSPGG